MIIALTEYARLHNRSGDTLRRLAESGALKNSKKKSGEIGLLIARKRIRQKNGQLQSPLRLFLYSPVAAVWI